MRRVPGNQFAKSSNLAKEGLNDEQKTGASISLIFERSRREDELDLKFRYPRLNDNSENQKKLGWLINVQPFKRISIFVCSFEWKILSSNYSRELTTFVLKTLIEDKESHKIQSVLDLYFLEQDGSTFKISFQYYPYFYLKIKKDRIREAEIYLKRTFEQYIEEITSTTRLDLEMKNHLAGLKATYLKVSFLTIQDLIICRKNLLQVIKSQQSRNFIIEGYREFEDNFQERKDERDYHEYIEDIREYDIPYYQRVLIDTNLRVSKWYDIDISEGKLSIEERKNMEHRAQPKVLAFDIECTKAPLKFPDATKDEVMMISYMIDGQGYLIINRMHVGEDIDAFEYTPLPDIPGPFEVWNEKDEISVLGKFIDHIVQENPNIFVTFNGDAFDWKFLENRCKILGIPLSQSIGLNYNIKDEYYSMRYACHLDVFRWVRRDSYLPQGSQGLKAVTRVKLGYDPLEIDPELMVKFALERPTTMAQYSVSDAVATYYLYMKYVHPFIFSLCNILPMNPDDVLRKGTGTLCESLLMVEAHKLGMIFPNKKVPDFEKIYENHLIESETYVGGHVEALSTGIYRSDLPLNYKICQNTINELQQNLEKIIDFSVTVECNSTPAKLINRQEIIDNINLKLEALKATPIFSEEPKIYHFDVAAMYPNIILTNRLQPTSIVDDVKCSNCLFNQPESRCKRLMEWKWRVDYLVATKGEYEQCKSQLELEMFPQTKPNGEEVMVNYTKLSVAEQESKLKTRLKEYSRKVYKKTHEVVTKKRKDIVCMRENPFYVDTVRSFRDRRYIYRTKAKEWGQKLEEAKRNKRVEEIAEASNMVVLYDSLQLAHKCILNSFYGYVMRKGARWYSMEMAAIVTYVGSKIIKCSRKLIEKIGKPLELDTDGIWCCLPKSFPLEYELLIEESEGGKICKKKVNFICSTLNATIHKQFSNTIYQELVDPNTLEYSIRTECTIFFEVDGPYHAMFLPQSMHEGKQLKKRYAVFGYDGQLHEFKGFELKRRGELKVIKDFQSQIFSTFLSGKTLKDAYDAAAQVAKYFLDIINTKAEVLSDQELLELLSESRSMSRNLEDYGEQKSTSITTAKRLAEFLGDLSANEKGLNCQFIISKKPVTKSVTDRTIPIQIFSAPSEIQYRYLRRWCDDNSMIEPKLRDILDWDYYRVRLSNQFQKLITLPSYMQGLQNPLPQVVHPDWLLKHQRLENEKSKQKKISQLFSKAPIGDVEDLIIDNNSLKKHSSLNENQEDLEITEDKKNKIYENHHKSNGSRNSSFLTAGNESDEKFFTFRKKSKRLNCEDGDEVNNIDNPPNEREDPLGWLEWHKRKWRIQRNRRKIRKQQLKHDKIVPLPVRTEDLNSFLNRNQCKILNNTWHILQIRESETPGVLTLWFITDGETLHQANLEVPRKFYLNSYVPRPEYSSMEAKSILPRLRPRHHLYEIEVNEQAFQEHYHELLTQRCTANIEGFYESQVSLIFRAILQLGCMCKVSKKHLSDNLSQIWKLDQLECVQSSLDNSYLPDPHPRSFYLYQTGASNKLVLFGLHNRITNRCNIIYCSPAPLPDPISSLMKIDEVKEHNLTFEFVHRTSLDRAASVVNEIIGSFKRINSGPIVIISQSDFVQEHLEHWIPILKTLPVLKLAPYKKDSIWPPLGWLPKISLIFVHRVLQMDKWYETAIRLTRYAQVPIGNFENDFAIFLSDILFARKLKSSDMILWYSKSTLLDLGGNEDDDYAFSTEILNPQFVNPDCVDSVCIEFDLYDLAINSIMQSNYISDLDRAFLMMDNAQAESGLTWAWEGSKNPKLAPNALYFAQSCDETASCIRAFKILKNLVTTWSVDTITYPGTTDLFLHTFHRWISSSKSAFYDPALHKLVHKLIKKVFIQFLAELKRLGAEILFATFDKLIINTNKRTLLEAQAYCSFLQKTLKVNRELFKWIEMKPVRFFDVLIFKDIFNYIGIDAMNSTVPQSYLSSEIVTDSIEDQENQSSQREEVNNRRLNSNNSFIEKDIYKDIFIEDGNNNNNNNNNNNSNSNESSDNKDIYDNTNNNNNNESSDNKDIYDNTNNNNNNESSDNKDIYDNINNNSNNNNYNKNNDSEIQISTNNLQNTNTFEKTRLKNNELKMPLPVSQLQAINYLPKHLRTHLNMLLLSFIYELYKHKQKLLKIMQENPSIIVLHDAQVVSENHKIEESTAKAVDLISEYYNDQNLVETSASPYQREVDQALIRTSTDQLVQILEQMQILAKEKRTWNSSDKYQRLKQLMLQNHTPELDLIEIAISFLSLRKSIEIPIISLKRNLLKSIKFNQFDSSIDVNEDLFPDYILSNIVCEYCNSCRDLNLLKDPRIFDDNWNCPTCSSIYDKKEIECRLVGIIEKWANSYQTQDISCEKCAQLQIENMSQICTNCSGKLIPRHQIREFKKKLNTMEKIAKFHRMYWLEDLLKFSLPLVVE